MHRYIYISIKLLYIHIHNFIMLSPIQTTMNVPLHRITVMLMQTVKIPLEVTGVLADQDSSVMEE